MNYIHVGHGVFLIRVQTPKDLTRLSCSGAFAGLSSNLPEPHTTPLLVPTERQLGGTLTSRCTRSTYGDSCFLDSGAHQRVRRVGVRGCR